MTRPTLTGIMPLRNAACLGYPFELAIRSLQRLCDDVVIGVDPMSVDNTMDQVESLLRPQDRILESVWDMDNHAGHTNCEISVQTQRLCDAATGDWVFSLQADEVLHESDVDTLRRLTESVTHHSAIECPRLYFYGGIDTLRMDWTLMMVRMFKRGRWKPDVDGAMRFDPINVDGRLPQSAFSDVTVNIFHYSRIGDPQAIAERVRNLDGFFHAPAAVEQGDIAPYDFGTLRKLDTYVKGAPCEVDPGAVLVPFDVSRHPAEALEYFRNV